MRFRLALVVALALHFVSPPIGLVQTVAPSQTVASLGSKVWVGRYEEFETFLKSGEIGEIKHVPIGVTKPRRLYFKPGGLASSAVVKAIQPGRSQGFWESYKSEIAAYELDKVLHMDMVPPYVERRVEGDRVALGLWVENVVWNKEKTAKGQKAPHSLNWNRQVFRHRVFDNLIANIDRNEGNLLVDPEWNLILIDHTRAFTPAMTMPFEKQMTAIDRPFYKALKALDEATLQERVGPWVFDKASLNSLLRRRDRIVARFEKLIAQKGEAQVLIP